MFLTKEIVRAARALLNWTQQELAEAAGISHGTLSRFEGEAGTHGETISKLALALRRAGIEFVVEGDEVIGVKKSTKPRRTKL